jgi:phenylacetate-CoA ligase
MQELMHMKTEAPAVMLKRLSCFINTSLAEIMRSRMADDPREQVLGLFHQAAVEVPAYRQFLQAHGVDPAKVNSFEDFTALPLTDKANYMRSYPLPQRCKGGSLAACDRLAVSSGSTGSPMFWPRTLANELDVALRFEQVFRNSFRAHERETLAVVCFPLGNWVGGMFTASCCWHLAQKGYPLTVATPGNKPDEILRVVRELAGDYQQVVLLGYPPFVRDVVEMGVALGLDWSAHSVKFVFAGEVYSEEWRSLMMRRVGSSSPCHDSASLYGTADGGVLGNETPLSIAIRRFLAVNPAIARELFGESRLPTLVQYDPISRFFEWVDGATLAVSGDNGVPLIRYHIADRGGIMGYGDMLAFLDERGFSVPEGLVMQEGGNNQPFVWVFGRADFTVSFYGANIYPENVMVGLEQAELSEWVSGKFVMEVGEGDQGRQFLHIVIELLPTVTADADKQVAIAQSVRAQLLRLNSEFAHYVPPDRQIPQVDLLPFADPAHFPSGVKHRYTRKQ